MNGSTTTPVKLAALGGLGEIGLNAMLLEWERQVLMVDAGAMFPEERAFGSDLIIPEFACLARGGLKLAAVVLTHAHEDHIGALPYLLRRFPAPVYGTKTTLAFARHRLQERGLGLAADLREIEPRQRFEAGPFKVEPIRVTHSTPDSVALAIDTPAGMIVHTGDFKIDEAPIDGAEFDRARFAELGGQGVILLLSDSTNVERPGRAASEASLKPTLRELVSRSRGKFFLTAFSSHIHRIRQVAEVAHEFGRRVVPLGRSVIDSVRLGIALGHLNLPPGVFISEAEAEFHDSRRLTFIAAGSQGEPLSAMMKLATESHPRVRVDPGDTVVLSSRFIPGNERTINRLVNHLHKRGAEVFYETVASVHVSGHACQDELAEMIALVRPKHFVPIHGEYRHLARHAALAIQAGVAESKCFILEDGQSLLLSTSGVRRGASIEAGAATVDADESADFEVIRERQALAREGAVVAIVAVSRATGAIIAGPDLISHGFMSGNGNSPPLRAAQETLRRYLETRDAQALALSGALRPELARRLADYFIDTLGKRPIIVPCVVEVSQSAVS